jgi:4-amino-4-deoxy-L-arabinose transferase-like glycosyltransferase
LALCAVLFFVGIGSGDLVRNEGLRAVLAADLLRGGSWAVPTLHGQPHLTKPPGMSVAIALCSLPFGEVTAASARLPSALAGACVVLLFYAAFARRLGRRAGLAAAALLACCPLWLGRAPSAEIDMVQLAWVTASLFAFLRAVDAAEEGDSGCRQWVWWQLALLCVAGGTLTKWTAPAFFYLTAVPLLAWRRRLGLLLRPAHLASLTVAAALCLAWGLAAVRQAGWDALADTVRREALLRLSPAHHPRPYPWRELLTFPLGFLAGCLPASAFALLAVRRGFGRDADERTRRLLQLLLCWAWANLLFWTLVPGHRPRHALPLQPAVAGLAALVLAGWLKKGTRFISRRGWERLLLGLVLAWLAVKVVYVGWVCPSCDGRHRPRRTGELLAALVPAGQRLHLFGVKDEDVLFYFGRPALRLSGPTQLPTGRAYCLLTAGEWSHWPADLPGRVVDRLRDTQGAPLVLVAVGR